MTTTATDKPTTKRRRRRRRRHVICLRPDCYKPAQGRGLCGADYAVAYTLVKEGKTTWRYLERTGKATPVVTPVEQRRRWFLNGKA